MSEAINTGGGHEESIVALARNWIQSLVAKGLISRTRIYHLCDLGRTMLQSDTGQDLDQQIRSIIEDMKRAGYSEKMKLLETLFCRKYAAVGQTTEQQPHEVSQVEAGVAENVELPLESDGDLRRKQQQRARHLRRLGSFTSPLSSKIPDVKGAEKLQLLKQIQEEVDARQPEERLTSAMRSLVYQVVNPVLRCLQKHCSNDPQIFLQRWATGDDFPHNKFSSKRCSGKGIECSYLPPTEE